MGAVLAALDMTAQRPHGTSPWAEGPRPQASRRAHRAHRRAAHLGIGAHPESSLMMPGIIISLIFSEQGKLILRATLLQNELAGAL